MGFCIFTATKIQWGWIFSHLIRYSKFYQKKLSTNKSRKNITEKYYPKNVLSKMYVTYSTSLYMNNFPMLHVTYTTWLYGDTSGCRINAPGEQSR